MTDTGLSGALRLGRPDAPRRVVLLHFAGGSAASLVPLAHPLMDTCAVVLLDLNGWTEPAVTFEEAVDRVRPEFEEAVDRPTVVFGHSMGALMAHRLLGRLPREHRRQVTDAVFSASRSPATTSRLATFPPGPFTTRTRADLLDDMNRYGGCPPELFNDPVLLDQAVHALARDMQLIDTYATPPDAGTFESGTAYHIWYGEDDDEAGAAEAALWSDDLPRAPRVRGFRGGHFYPLEHPEAARALRRLTFEGNGST